LRGSLPLGQTGGVSDASGDAAADPPSAPRPGAQRRRLDVDDYVAGVRAGDRAILARAITLVESLRPQDLPLAQAVLQQLLPETGGAYRVGITGTPGVGKSTLIEALGTRLADRGKRVAVLAVDPSSSVTGGSILGDKTRMARLAQHPAAFIRPSPSGLALGGVARRTRETLLLCEAAGFDLVLVETVGVGQSETVVAGMVDFFLVLMQPGGGDELQGIKKGILELADAIAVNKADGPLLPRAREAQRDYAAALRYLPPRRQGWKPECVLVSGATAAGLDELWGLVERHREALTASGELEALRQEQLRGWMRSLVEEHLLRRFFASSSVRTRLPALEAAVLDGRRTPAQAAAELLELPDLVRLLGDEDAKRIAR